MSKSPFLKTVFSAMEDEINHIDFEKISRKYTAKRLEIEAIMKTLDSLPETIETEAGTVNVQGLIEDLGELYEHLFGISFDIAIKRGFSLAYKFIFYSLTMDAGESLTDKGKKAVF